jgi:hypothetical protein
VSSQPSSHRAHVPGAKQIVELHERHDAEAAGDDDRPQVRDRVEHAGQQAPDDVVLHAEPPERHTRRHGDDDAREHGHAEEAADLRVDLVHDLDGDLLLRERRPRDLHQLAFVQVAGNEEEVHEEQHHSRLTEEPHQSGAARPEILPRVEGRLDDLHPGHAGDRLDRFGRALRRLLDFRRGAFHLLKRTIPLPALPLHAIGEPPRSVRNAFDDRECLIG